MNAARTAALAEHAELQAGFAFDSKRFNDSGRGVPVVRIRDVVRGTTSTFYDGPFDDRFVVEDGDLLIGMDGEFNVSRWRGGRALLNQRVAKVVGTSRFLELGYLTQFLAVELKRIEAITPSVTVKHLSMKTLSAIAMSLPPRAEQLRVAEMLETADRLRTLRQTAIDTLDALGRAAVEQAAVETQAVRPLGDLLERIDSGRSPVCADRAVSDGEWGVLKLGAISSGSYRPEQNKALLPGTEPVSEHEVRVGDVLLSRKNTIGLVGASAYVWDTPPRLLLPDLIFRLVPRSDSGVSPLFLQAALARSPARIAIRRLSGGTAGSMPNISKERLRVVAVPIPSIEAQNRCDATLEQVSVLRRQSVAHLRRLDALFESLQHRAFAGTRGVAAGSTAMIAPE